MTREEFMTRVTVVNFKESRGHDAPSLEWDIKFDNVKVCNCWDDSYGGELQVTDYKNHRIDNIYSTIDKDSLWDEKYKWTTPLDILLEECLNNHLEKKDYDKWSPSNKRSMTAHECNELLVSYLKVVCLPNIYLVDIIQ